MHVLVAGGSGVLGRHVVREAFARGHQVRVMSRRSGGSGRPEMPVARADLATGDGVQAALAGVDAVIHAASDPRRAAAVDAGGTRRLVEAAQRSGVAHVVYVSIVGADRIPLSYYAAKVEAERAVAGSAVPHSILRATQFHSLVDRLMRLAARVPFVLPLPADFQVQSVAVREVAARLVRALDDGPGGRLPDMGGPETMTLGEAAEAWQRAHGVRKRIVRVPLAGAAAAGFRAGLNTVPDGDAGAVRWAEWLSDPDA